MYLRFMVLCFFLQSLAEDIPDMGFCEIEDKSCSGSTNFSSKKLLFYDVNPPEGFNLRRDVYMRLAIMFSEARKRNIKENWSLVLPPWYRLYHWRSEHRERSKPIPWSQFFDLKAMKSYAPVVELQEIFENPGKNSKFYELDRIYVLKNYVDMFDGNFKERWEIVQGDCDYDGQFWGYSNITAKEIVCVNFLGKASKLWELFSQHPNDKKVMIAHAEIVLHDNYGTKEYWDCRKSMKFNTNLENTARKYIQKHFNCTVDKCDLYISIHWRRQDFASSRSKDVPSILSTVKQLQKIIKQKTNNITHIFIATDAPQTEVKQLQIKLKEVKLQPYLFTPGQSDIENFKDGGLAIIDQIICSHAAIFVGTHESTFTFRIQEEREILGFESDTTFNRFCPDIGKCEIPSKWTIVN